MSAPTEFVLLTGFLGSGKTSLLVDWLALPEAADTAIIVNEAGEINVDGAIIAESGTIPMAMLANGCVCCSLTNDLVFTIRALVDERIGAGLPPFRRIVLEASGLSRPGPILRSLAPLAPLKLAVRVVTTCDASQAAQRAAYFDEVASQLAAASTIVFTKLDLAGAGPAEALTDAINPFASRVVEPDRVTRARAAFAPAPSAALMPVPARMAMASAHPRVAVLRASFTQSATWEDRLDWMEDLAAFCGERLLRVKGFIRRPGTDTTMLVQAVGTLFSPPVPMSSGADLPEVLVIIARDLTAGDLRNVNPDAPVSIAHYRSGEPLICAPAFAPAADGTAE
jgi:G3E family GTPase